MNDDHLKKIRNKNVNSLKKSGLNDEPDADRISDGEGVAKKSLIDDSLLHSNAENVDYFWESLRFNVEFDVITMVLFLLAAATRFYKISHPNHVV